MEMVSITSGIVHFYFPLFLHLNSSIYNEDAVNQLTTWNEGKKWGLSFGDAHELSSCRSDDTNNRNIKKNCSQNLDHSKYFVLIVGDKTKDTRAGYCMYCKAYNTCSYTYKTNKSFIEFE